MENARHLRSDRHRRGWMKPSLTVINGGKPAASSRAAGLSVERGEEGLRVLLLLEYVRSDVAAGEGLPKLHTHEGARREAGNRRVIVFEHVPVHVRIVVVGAFGYAELVIVDDDADPLADLFAPLLQQVAQLHNVGLCPDVHSLEIEEQYIALLIVGNAVGQVEIEQMSLKPHWFVLEYADIHRLRLADDWFEIHMRQNIPFDVDTGRDLYKG